MALLSHFLRDLTLSPYSPIILLIRFRRRCLWITSPAPWWLKSTGNAFRSDFPLKKGRTAQLDWHTRPYEKLPRTTSPAVLNNLSLLRYKILPVAQERSLFTDNSTHFMSVIIRLRASLIPPQQGTPHEALKPLAERSLLRGQQPEGHTGRTDYHTSLPT
jgi:hypothetical protein